MEPVRSVEVSSRVSGRGNRSKLSDKKSLMREKEAMYVGYSEGISARSSGYGYDKSIEVGAKTIQDDED